MARAAVLGFTLVELLVVIGIIALLVGILLPTLSKAREAGNTIKCASNLRSISQGLAIYIAENKGTFPAAYLYDGMALNGTIGNATTETPTSAVTGYVHWSSYLYRKGGNVGTKTTDLGSIYHTLSGWDMFMCPSLENGGLPPTNTWDGNLDAGQQPETAGVLDQQSPRLAYTVNEAVMPRNKFVQGFNGAPNNGHTYNYVRAGQVRRSAETVLATEFYKDWRVVSELSNNGGAQPVCKSHRPIHGFVGNNGGLQYDMQYVTVSSGGFGRTVLPAIFRVSTGFVSPYRPPAVPPFENASRLNWIGRNHGRGKTAKTNFLYCDGHAETKVIEDTVGSRWEWGNTFYSLQYRNDISDKEQPAP